jgi:hypothetical protein
MAATGVPSDKAASAAPANDGTGILNVSLLSVVALANQQS